MFIYHRGLGFNNFPERAAARAWSSRIRVTACSSKAARSAAPTDACVGRTQAVGHRVIPFDRINSAIASQSLSDIFPPSAASSSCRDGGVYSICLTEAQTGRCVTIYLLTSITKMVNIFCRAMSPHTPDRPELTIRSKNRFHETEAGKKLTRR